MKRILSITIAFAVTLFSTATAQSKTVYSKGFAVFADDGKFKPYTFQRHAVGDNEIQIDILYASICHSDVHHVRADWGKEEYPMVPGIGTIQGFLAINQANAI